MLVSVAILVTLMTALVLPNMWQTYDKAEQLLEGGIGTGLTATYYEGPNFTGTSHTRIDERVDFDWGKYSPAAVTATDHFSAAWVGMIRPEHDETYSLHIASTGGIRLWVNTSPIIDAWDSSGLQEHIGIVDLRAGQPANLTINFQARTGNESISFAWASDSTPADVIPTPSLYPVIRNDISIRRRLQPSAPNSKQSTATAKGQVVVPVSSRSQGP